MPDWALVARMLWTLDHIPKLLDHAELIEAHRLFDASERLHCTYFSASAAFR